jgi:signal transduction histidine kinase
VVFDLSDDPLGYSVQEIERIKALWERMEGRALFDGRSYAYLRQAFESSLGRYFRAVSRAVKWIGGIYHSRVHVGDAGQELPFTIVEAEQQARALELIRAHFLETDAFSFHPDFLRKMQYGRFSDFEDESAAARAAAAGGLRIDFSLIQFMKQYDQSILALLYDPLRLSRILENAWRTREKTLPLEGYLETIRRSIWAELEKGGSIGTLRRILQREHIAKLTGTLLKPSPAVPSDATALLRHELRTIEREITGFLATSRQADLVTRAHLEDCAIIIAETLKAADVRGAQ